MVTASGIRTLSRTQINNRNILIIAIPIGVAMIPVVAPNFYDQFPDWFVTIFHSGISAGAIVAILLNLLLNTPDQREKAAAEGPVAYDAVRGSPGVPENSVELPVGEATGKTAGVPATVRVPIDPR